VNCRSCGSADLVEVIDLGRQRLSDFRNDLETPPKFPLTLLLCDGCGLVQLTETVPRSLMYHDRYGFKSGVNDSVRADHQGIVKQALEKHPDATSWLDIACNDGTLLSLVPNSLYRIGVDPVAKYTGEAVQHASGVITGYFDANTVQGRFDVVTAISMFYDIDDLNTFVEGLAKVLAPGGVLVVQQNYLADTVRLGAVDNICHEHITYFTLEAMLGRLERHGLEVFHVDRSMVNGGSLRTLISHAGARKPDSTVARTLAWEQALDLRDKRTYRSFWRTAKTTLNDVYELVEFFSENRRPVYIYGASTRGGTLWQAAGITSELVPFAVDRNPEKVGRMMSSIGVPIISEEEARKRNPRYMLVSPWFFRDDFLAREAGWLAEGGKFIFPLPKVELVGYEKAAA
jgi:SAM-dependent methyltransferase